MAFLMAPASPLACHIGLNQSDKLSATCMQCTGSFGLHDLAVPVAKLKTQGCLGLAFEKDRKRAVATAAAHDHPPSKTEPPAQQRILISTGDVMGDIHGAALVKQLLKQAALAGNVVEVYALGGHRIEDAGAILIGNNTGLSSIGVFEALPVVVPSLRLQMIARAFLQKKPPDLVVLIDYPGVNLPFGQYLKKKFGCKIVYYIPPNEWLLSTLRTPTVVEISDIILSVYPGEAEYYRKAGGHVLEVGHPLADRAKQFTRKEARKHLGVKEDDLVVALLPASREQELRHVWPVIASAARLLLENLPKGRHARFFVPVVLSNRVRLLKESLEQYDLSEQVQIWDGTSDIVLAASDLAITKSGSVNLELALYNVPQVVVYKLSSVTAWIYRNILHFSPQHISLVNLILGEKLVPEFVQEDATAQNIVKAALELLPCNNSKQREKILEGYQRLASQVGETRTAEKAAKIILKSLIL